MTWKLIKEETIKEQNYGSILVKNLFDEEDRKSFSLAKVRVVGKQKFGADTESDNWYYVLDGSGTFYIEQETVPVKKGDIIFLPKSTTYKDEGTMTLLAMSTPRFDRSKRIRFEE